MHLKAVLWTLGGLAVGALAAVVVAALVFWVFPTVRRARSPLAEIVLVDVVVHYLKASSLAPDIGAHAAQVQSTWRFVLEQLSLQSDEVPGPIHVYLYATAEELPLGYAARVEAERTWVAVVDHVWGQPLRGALGRVACSLVFGRPGNTVFRRGLAMYLDDPDHPWAAEAQTWADSLPWPTLWERADRLLAGDPWDRLYFTVNAPWVGAVVSLEAVQALLLAQGSRAVGRGRMWEVMAGALAEWALSKYGRRGIEALWRTSSWAGAAASLATDLDLLTLDLNDYTRTALASSPHGAYLKAVTDVFQGRPERALQTLAALAGDEVRRMIGMAHLALGAPELAVAAWSNGTGGELAPLAELLAQAQRSSLGRLVLVGGSGDAADVLASAHRAVERALAFCDLPESDLPDRIAFYFVPTVPMADVPRGVVWVTGGAEAVPALAVRVVLEIASPAGLPAYRTMVEGLILHLAYPDRDFRAEVAQVLGGGRWVSLSQPLFESYPVALAEAEAGAFVRYLLTAYGEERLRDLWSRLEAGASPFAAVEQALGVGLLDLEREMHIWLRRP